MSEPLTKAAILAAVDRPLRAIDIPEWGGRLWLRTMSGAERDALEAEHSSSKGKPLVNFRARFAVRVLCNEAGERLFTDADAPLLGAKSAKALDRILDVAGPLNGIGAAEADHLAGESAGDRNADSGSGSLLPSA